MSTLLNCVKKLKGRKMPPKSQTKSSNPSKNILAINKYDLDTETAKQPLLYKSWAKKACKKRFEYDKAKANHEVLKAKVELEIRRDPDRFNLPKVTEDTIKSAIAVDQRLIDSEDNVLQLKLEAAELDVLVKALEQRKKSIEDLIQLFFRDYFAKPKTKKVI